MATKYAIRDITHADVPKVAMLGRIIAEEYTHDLKPNTAHFSGFLNAFIGASEFHFHKLIERNDTVYGFMLAFVSFNLYSGYMQCTKATWVTHSAAAGYGRRLMKLCESWAREKGCKTMYISGPNEKVARLLEHSGYTFKEATFGKDL